MSDFCLSSIFGNSKHTFKHKDKIEIGKTASTMPFFLKPVTGAHMAEDLKYIYIPKQLIFKCWAIFYWKELEQPFITV